MPGRNTPVLVALILILCTLGVLAIVRRAPHVLSARGDVIVEVNRHAVHSAADAGRLLSAIKSGQPAFLLLSRGDKTIRCSSRCVTNKYEEGRL